MSMVYFSSMTGYFVILTGCILGAASVESLLLQWVCLEVNMLCVIPILLSGSSEDSIMNGVKYFVSQSSASVVFLISIMLADNISLSGILATLAIVFKLGIPPFHSWMLSIIMSVGVVELVLILTLQKFIPLMILSQMELSMGVMGALSAASLIMIAISMNSNFSFNYMLFLSSVGNGMWMVVSLISGAWVLFLSIYSLMLAMVVLFLVLSKLSKLSDISTSDGIKKVSMAFHFLNLGGVPPLMGFSVKLMVLKSLSSVGLALPTLLVLLSLMVLYIYVSMMYQAYTFTPEALPLINNSGAGEYSTLSVASVMLFSVMTWVVL